MKHLLGFFISKILIVIKSIFKDNLTFEKFIFNWKYEMIILLFCVNIIIHEFEQFWSPILN